MEANDPKKKWEWGNSIGYILLPFDISLHDDPLDYIRSAKATIDKKKQSLESVLTYSSAKLMLKTLGLRVCTFSLVHHLPTFSTVLITSLFYR